MNIALSSSRIWLVGVRGEARNPAREFVVIQAYTTVVALELEACKWVINQKD